jgi:hypothetical protein
LTSFNHEQTLLHWTAEEEDAARDADFDSLLSRGELDAEIAQFVPAEDVPFLGETLDDMNARIVAECTALLDRAQKVRPTLIADLTAQLTPYRQEAGY